MEPKKASEETLALYELVMSADLGMDSKTLAAMTGLTLDGVGGRLRMLRRLGYPLAATGNGSGARWVHVDRLEAARAFLKERTKAKEKMRMYLKQKERRAKQRSAFQSIADAMPETDHDPIVRVIVPAAAALPLNCKAPRSVFELAAYL